MKAINNPYKHILIAMFALGGMLGFSACEQQSPSEEIAEELEETAESDDLEEAVDEMEEVGEEIKDAATE